MIQFYKNSNAPFFSVQRNCDILKVLWYKLESYSNEDKYSHKYRDFFACNRACFVKNLSINAR